MPKGIDPKAYAARVTKAKKTVANMDPAVKQKIKDMYPASQKRTKLSSLERGKLKPEIKLKEVMPKPKATMTLKDLEKKIRTKPEISKMEKYEKTKAAKAKVDKMKAKVKKDFGKK